ncbi:hypothetical protein [Jidongwangia harbinensis]|uniref:hypothetical protein n=1 Tax=Jidongwangia harbinensis TaxID=2878561 RepID=UPI001CD99B6C|nr:hypothetical protein [Jidongwangia harbinensis]MCA2214247.1 hypothetical protein [Jidongwangia harbinensis]
MDLQQRTATGNQHGTVLRPVLWVVLVISAALNAVFSSTLENPLVGVAFGLVALSAIAGLVVHHYRHRQD